MKVEYCISILICLMFLSCKGPVAEMIKVKEIVDKAKDQVKSNEYQLELNRIETVDEARAKLIKEIDASKSIEIVTSKDEVIKICDELKHIFRNSEHLLEKKHGFDTEGNLNNRMDTKHVNHIFIEQGKAQEIKELLSSSISRLKLISSSRGLQIEEQSIPLIQGLWVDTEGQTWEKYIFQDMPPAGLLPVFTKWKNDVILTELLMLERLAIKSK